MKTISSFILFLTAITLMAEPSSMEKALEAFRAADYPKALEWLYQARDENPDDPQIYYYLGYFSHYMVYDSRPFPGQSFEWSQQQVINNLEKALELNPELGDARYFLGVEHISRAWEYLKLGDEQQLRQEYQKAFDKGGLPPWMIEEGRNHLRACPPDAILFINGDLHFNAISWLQIMEGYRPDVSVITMALLNRPFYLKVYRDGIPGISLPVPLSWTDLQLGELQHFKWRPQQLSLPVPSHILQNYNVDAAQDTMQWLIEPDLITPGKRTFLSPGMAAFIDIIEQNNWERPVFIAMPLAADLPVGNFRRQHGPIIQILPFNTAEHNLDFDEQVTHDFYFNGNNFRDFSSLAGNNFPRVSGVLFNHHFVMINLCRHYYDQQQWEKALMTLQQINFSQ